MIKRLEQIHPVAKLGIGGLIVLVLLLIGYRFGSSVSLGNRGGTVSVSGARVTLRQGGNIYFNVTFGTEEYLKRLGEWERAERRIRTSQAFVLSATTHVGSIKDLSLDGKIFLRGPDGVVYPSVGKVLESAAHHDTWLVFFPRYDMKGEPLFERDEGSFDVLIRNVEKLPERVFTFRYPLPVGNRSSRPDAVYIFMLIAAAMAAMLVSCTPCLVGALTVGSLSMGTAWSPAQKEAIKQVRAEMVKRTVYYLIALVIAYIAIAVAINVFKIRTEQLRPVEFVGGLVLLVIGLGFLRSWKLVARLEDAVVNLVLRVAPGFRKYVTDKTPDPSFGPNTSTAMGASLAMVCSVAGAPTLTTAIILPMMIYAGLTDFYWSLMILAVFLLVCAFPFFLIAIGLGEFLSTASLRFRNGLLVVNSFLLIGLGLLLLFDPQRVVNILSTPAELLVKPFRWLV
jgi:hypothetical protein